MEGRSGLWFCGGVLENAFLPSVHGGSGVKSLSGAPVRRSSLWNERQCSAISRVSPDPCREGDSLSSSARDLVFECYFAPWSFSLLADSNF